MTLCRICDICGAPVCVHTDWDEYRTGRFVLFRYPIEKWNQFFQRHAIFAATATEKRRIIRQLGIRLARYDVGVDVKRFVLVSVAEIVAFFDKA